MTPCRISILVAHQLARLALTFVLAFSAAPSVAGTLTIKPNWITEWKAVYGRVETRDTIAARTRIGGTLMELLVTEGEQVLAGQRIATVHDDKIAFQIAALDSQLKALNAQLANAEEELTRGRALVDSGVSTTQRLGQLTTQVDVYRNQIAATEAQRQVLLEQSAEGEVLAPSAGMVLTVPVTKGAVLMTGEPVATIGSGGFFLRLAIPERHAELLQEGAAFSVEAGTVLLTGQLSKLYPQIENGRVIADLEVKGVPTDYVDRRVLVHVPVGTREALLVPKSTVTTRSGIDFITVMQGEVEVERAVVLGATEGEFVEVVTGLSAGDSVVTP